MAPLVTEVRAVLHDLLERGVEPLHDGSGCGRAGLRLLGAEGRGVKGGQQSKGSQGGSKTHRGGF